jgi:excisionase family DNA binding protein
MNRNHLTTPAQPTNGHAETPTLPPDGTGAEPAKAPRAPLPPLLLDVGQMTELLNVSVITVKRLVRDEVLPPGAVVHLGRRRLFSRPLIEKWVGAGCPSHAKPGKRGTRRGR